MPAMMSLEPPCHRGPGEPLGYAPLIFLLSFAHLAGALGDHHDLRPWGDHPRRHRPAKNVLHRTRDPGKDIRGESRKERGTCGGLREVHPMARLTAHSGMLVCVARPMRDPLLSAGSHEHESLVAERRREIA